MEGVESLHLEMDQPSRKLLVAQDATAAMILIGMTSVYANAETALELELHRVKSALRDADTKLEKFESDLEGSSKAIEDLEKAEEVLRNFRS